MDGNDKSRRFTGPPTPSGLTAAAASLSKKETKRIKEWKHETFTMWARRIRGNSEWGRSTSSLPLRWAREGGLLQTEIEEAADQEVWRIYRLPPHHSAPEEWSVGASVAVKRPVPCLNPLCCLFLMHRNHKNVKQDRGYEAIGGIYFIFILLAQSFESVSWVAFPLIEGEFIRTLWGLTDRRLAQCCKC